MCLARSLLFVPATRPERFAKALESRADCIIIIDLEDAMSPDSKDSARDQLAQHLPLFSPVQLARTLVRVNATGTEWHDRDIESLRDWTRQSLTVMLPKSEDEDVICRVGERLGFCAASWPLPNPWRVWMRPIRWPAKNMSFALHSAIWTSSSISACAPHPMSRNWHSRATRSCAHRAGPDCLRRLMG